MDEPTRGIDVGAKRDIYLLMGELVKAGKALLMISSEIPEIMGLSDRIIVLAAGRLTGEIKRPDFSQESIMRFASDFSSGDEHMNKTLRKKSSNFHLFGKLAFLSHLFVILAILMILSPNAFAKPANLVNILKQASINGILATGMMFVIISGGIDLSVGSIVALTGVIAATFAHPGEYPLIVPIVLSAVIGAAVGLLNGVSVAYGNIPPFIVTLGTMTIVRGVALIAAKGQPVFDVTKLFEGIAGGFVFNTIPHLVVYFV